LLSFYVVNLLIPDDPMLINLALASGTWTLTQHPDFAQFKEAIGRGQVGETYFLENPVTLTASPAVVDSAFHEITPILLAASYLTGLSVTIQRSTMGSEISIVQPSQHWPRARAVDRPSPVIASAAEFSNLVELFVRAWPRAGQTEKARLLVHHWLDALSCWSMEDLYLSTTTLLQVIVATEAAEQGKAELRFYDGVEAAARRKTITTLSDNFKNMRNDLIHDGRLIGTRFAGPDKEACAAVVADVLNWFDEYMHAALGLGAPRMSRFGKSDFMNLNAYSID
jgi:hypothetical protein